MTHVSDDDIMLLAETVEEHLVFSKDQLIMMEHLKTCRECYEKFCAAQTLLEVTGDYSYPVLSKIYGMEPAKSLVENAGAKTLAVVKLAGAHFRDSVKTVLEQVSLAGDIFRFQPTAAMATRGMGDPAGTVYKLEDINDDKTFIAVDPYRQELLLQINTKDVWDTEIRAYIQFASGERIDVHMEQKGRIFKGKVSELPEEDMQVVIKAAE